MKQGRKPTRQERILLKSLKLDPAVWLVYKNTSTELHLVHRHSDKTTRIIPKGE